MTDADRFSGAPMEITKRVTFEAAHRLPTPGAPGMYGRLHGHSFVLEVTLRGAPDAERGWVHDLGELDTVLAAVKAELDHGYLNDLEGLERPTLERLCGWVAGKLSGRFDTLARVSVERPSLGERCVLEVDA